MATIAVPRVTIPPDLHRRLKLEAARRGEKLQAVTARVIRLGLERERKAIAGTA
jgi:hypothetical protein